MNPTPQQFTPAHFLSAARRAEAEGKLDLAVQFYRHIAEHFSTSAEALEARDGIQRLGAARKPEPGRTPGRPPSGEGHEARASAPTPPPLASASSQRPAAQRERHAPVRTPGARPVFVEAPEVAPRYLVGRCIAYALATAGFLAMAGGLAAVAMATTGMLPALAAKVHTILPEGWVPGAVLAGGGLIIVFTSQLALAVFDTANAARERAAIERAKAGL